MVSIFPAKRAAKPLVPFYDDRFASGLSAGQFLHDPRVLESRARARRALQVHRELNTSKDREGDKEGDEYAFS